MYDNSACDWLGSLKKLDEVARKPSHMYGAKQHSSYKICFPYTSSPD